MGLFTWSNDGYQPDQEILDKANIQELKYLAEVAGLSLEDYIKELNKQLAIQKGLQVLEQLDHKDVIAINHDDENLNVTTTYIVKNKMSNITDINQYIVK